MSDLPGWVQTLLASLAGGAGVYAAVRADIADLKARVTNGERMDVHLLGEVRRVEDRVNDMHSKFGDL